MAEGHVCGQYTTHEWGGDLGKKILTILVFEINKGKNAQKVKKNNHNLSFTY
jgi:hypothetical protein